VRCIGQGADSTYGGQLGLSIDEVDGLFVKLFPPEEEPPEE
jgi:hypothetical protein